MFFVFTEPNLRITPPTVKVLPPSPDECYNQKYDKLKNETLEQKNKTLVCVATGFYPDHVSVFWSVNEVNVTKGVATDTAALRVKDHYSITSRLMVPWEDWFNSNTQFTCNVIFYNGTDYNSYHDSIRGDEGMFMWN